MTVNIALDSTLCALGLKYILSEYFDINANIIADNSTPEAGDTSSALYIVTPARYCANLDFFIARRSRCIVTGTAEGTLDPAADESQIVDRLRQLLKSHDNSQSGQAATLSQREGDVLRLVALGLINKEIADRLNISFNTVLSHRKNITAKLGIKSVPGLSVYAMMNGYISEADLNNKSNQSR